MKEQESKDYYLVKDAIGRIWQVSKSAVRDDYILSIAALDNLTYGEVAAKLEANEDLGYWWREQVRDDFGLVSKWGVMVQDISPEQKESVLRSVAMQFPTMEIEDA